MNRDRLLLNEIRRKVDAADAVSFDVFDTLLLRPYARPADLFLHLELVENRPGFAQERYAAERRAEAKLGREIRLDDIYEEIDVDFHDLKKRETEFERQILCVNPELKQVYDYARAAGKKVVIASDMYLPSEIIEQALHKNGFDGWDMLLVSGDIGMAKHTGELFRYILHRLGVEQSGRLLHIGDNKQADYKVPRSLGIQAMRYKNVWRRFISVDQRLMGFYYGRERDIGASILLGMIAIRRQQERCGAVESRNYWRRLGYEYAGPVACAYAEFVVREYKEKGLTKLLWIARDGYTLKKMCDILHPEVKSAYIYAPRFLSSACRLDTDAKTPHICKRLTRHYAENSPKLQQSLIEEAPVSESEYKCFIHKYLPDVKRLAQQEMDRYRAYLSTEISGDDTVGMVDTITISFSAQKLLQEALDRPVYGIYWVKSEAAEYSDSKQFTFSEFVSNIRSTPDDNFVYTYRWDFMEFLLTAPEAPVLSISASLSPEHASTLQPEELCRIRIYGDVVQGAVDFARDLARVFGNNRFILRNKIIIDWINSFLQSPTHEDLRSFAPVRMAMDSAHTIYAPLFLEKSSLLQVLLHPSRTRKKLKRSYWRTPFQTFLLCLLKPFKLQHKSLRHISLAFLPHLRREHFIIALRLGRMFSIHFIVGKPTSIIFE